MAVQIDSPGQLQDLLDILRRRRWQVLLPFLAVLVLGSAFAVLVPKKYEVTSEVELRETLVSAGGASESIASRDVHNAPQQLISMKRIKASVEALEWEDYAELRTEAEKHDYLKAVQEDLTVELPRKPRETGSTFVSIAFLHIDKQRALDFLLELRTRWIEEVVQIDRLAIESKYEKLREQVGELEREIQNESEDLAQVRTAYNISPTQPTTSAGQSRREDPTFEQYEDLQDQLEELDQEIAADEDAIELLEMRLLETPDQVDREVEVEGETFSNKIQGLQAQRVQLVVALESYKPAHSRYRRILQKIDEIDRTIREFEENRIEGSVETEWHKNERYLAMEAELTEAEWQLAQKVRRREQLMSRIELLEGTMAELQQVYSEIDERTARISALMVSQGELALLLQETKVRREEINGPAGNPFQVTEEAQLPLRPTEPDPLIIIGFSVVLGLALGLGTALGLEFSKSAFRNPGDLSTAMVVPVLGVVNGIVTRAQERRRLVRRAAVAATVLGSLGFVVLVTYAWYAQPERLPSGMLDAIEDFRRLFR